MIKKFKELKELTRSYSLVVSLAPYTVALAWAFVSIQPNAINMLFSLIAIICLHLGANLYDDFIDVTLRLKKGEKLSEISFGDGKNKARLITNGTFSLEAVKMIIIGLFGVAFLIGFGYSFVYGTIIWQIMLLTAGMCAVYPVASKFYMSEVIIGLLFGVMLPYGVYYVLTGNMSLSLLHFSLSLAMVIIALAHTHSIMDWEYDEKNDKHTLARLCGSKKNAVAALGIMYAIAFINLGALIALGYVQRLFVIAFLAMPISVELIQSMGDYINVRKVELKPKFWMLPMEYWAQIKSEKREFFMYRFYLARNIIVSFALLTAIALCMSPHFRLIIQTGG